MTDMPNVLQTLRTTLSALSAEEHRQTWAAVLLELQRAGEPVDDIKNTWAAINRLRLKAERAWEAVQSIDHDERRTITEIWKVVGVAPADSEVPLEELVHQINGNSEVADQVYTELRDAMRIPVGHDARKVAAKLIQTLVDHLGVGDDETLPSMIETIVIDGEDDERELQEKSDRANALQQRIWDAERRLHHLLGGEGDADAVPLEHAVGAIESVVRSHTAATVVLREAGQGGALSLATGIADLAMELRSLKHTVAQFETARRRADAVSALMSDPINAQVIAILAEQQAVRMEFTTEKDTSRRRLVVTLS